jgi:hypothetical protein
MPENKVTFGISNMHVAFLGQAQTGKIEVTNPPSTDGEIELQVTADTLLGVDSPASNVELYTKKWNPPVEKEIENLFKSLGIAYQKSQEFLDDEDLYQTVYEISLIGG